MINALLTFLTLQAPVVITVGDDPKCADCRITATKVVALGSLASAHSPSALSTVVSNSRGEYIVGPTDTPGEIAVYSPTGTYLRSIGRLGTGPGELTGMFKVEIGPGDSLHVVSSRTRSVTVFDPKGSYVRQVSLGPAYDILPLTNGDVLVSGPGESSDNAGLVLHILGSSGQRKRSFGASATAINRAPLIRRALSHANAGTFWAGHPNEYTVDRWDFTGRLVANVHRNASWFPVWDTWKNGQPFAASPQPSIKFVSEDKQGRLWVAISIPDPHWTPVRPDRGAGAFTATMGNRVTDTVIEVIDVARRELLARRQFDEAIGPVGEGLVGVWRDGPDGETIIDVLRLDLAVNRSR